MQETIGSYADETPEDLEGLISLAKDLRREIAECAGFKYGQITWSVFDAECKTSRSRTVWMTSKEVREWVQYFERQSREQLIELHRGGDSI